MSDLFNVVFLTDLAKGFDIDIGILMIEHV